MRECERLEAAHAAAQAKWTAANRLKNACVKYVREHHGELDGAVARAATTVKAYKVPALEKADTALTDLRKRIATATAERERVDGAAVSGPGAARRLNTARTRASSSRGLQGLGR